MKKIKYYILSLLQTKLFLFYRLTLRKIIDGKEFIVSKATFRASELDDKWFIALAKNSQIIFDIGCNVGEYTLYSALLENVDKVVAIDANPKSLIVAAQNIFDNFLSEKVCFVCGFVSDSDSAMEELLFVDTGGASSKFSSFAGTAKSLNSKIRVPSYSLPRLFAKNGTPDFIKLDVEGAEFEVLNGAKAVLLNANIKILVEVHSGPELLFYDNLNRILNICDEIGYSVWYINERRKISSAETFSNKVQEHFLLLEKTRNFPDYL